MNPLVRGKVCGNVTKSPPLFPPELWSVFGNEELGFSPIQDKVKAWHEKWKTLTNRAHDEFLRLIQIQNEQNTVERKIERIMQKKTWRKKGR